MLSTRLVLVSVGWFKSLKQQCFRSIESIRILFLFHKHVKLSLSMLSAMKVME